MSFTGEIKQEVSYNELKPCCKRAELSALIQLTSSLGFSSSGMSLIIKSENFAPRGRHSESADAAYDILTCAILLACRSPS